MVNMTLSVPEDIYKEMQKHSDIRWSEVARQAFEHKIRELHWMEKLVEKSELSEEDVNRIGHAIKGSILKRFQGQE
jgi:predicted CopG family antitoxin